jgi:predicted DNA repair protein MutK
MAGGLVALLDDVAALAKLAAASIDDIGAAAGRATTKAAGVLIDDAAVTPQYVHGLAANRELPIIGRIAKGSLRNKFLFVIPALLLLSQLAPFLLTPILMLGGGYLCYEGAHKIYAAITGHGEHETASGGVKDEDSIVAGAIRTDLILSAEIMVIAVGEVESEPLLRLAAILAIVAVLITVMVYGVVAVIVKVDDVGLRLVEVGGRWAGLGRKLVAGMPKLLTVLATVGTAAMLWVGGHIEIEGLHALGVDWPYEPVHQLEEIIRESAGALGGFLAWSVNTLASAVVGLAVGALIVVVLQQVAKRRATPGH